MNKILSPKLVTIENSKVHFFFAKFYTLNWSEDVFVIKKVRKIPYCGLYVLLNTICY